MFYAFTKKLKLLLIKDNIVKVTPILHIHKVS